ncbi:MAG: leucine-rich repeat protein, partial [Clostridia bacterium]|nr:leucine-rich repeat protein [Clostridia bacterium]
MKKNFKISLSIVLAITMIFSSAYVGLGELDFKSAVVAGASQVSDGDLTFTLNDNGTEYYVTGSTSAVEGDLVIPDTYNALPVTLIEQNVFRDNTAITSVTMGGNINEIREHAFTGCDNLAAVYVKDLTAWCAIDFIYPESNPLYWAGNLYLNGELVTDLVIPEEVTHINPRVFYNCTSLTSVTVHDGLKSIGEYAFAGCKLEKVNVTDLTAWCGIEFDGYNANPLYYAPWLCLNGEVMSELVIPEGTEVISDYAFY